MTTFPVPPSQQLASMIARHGRQLGVTKQQVVNLQSGLSAATPQPWIPLALLNGWISISGYVPAGYRQFAAGVTEVIGVIGGGMISDGTVIAELPAGAYNAVHAWPFAAVILAGATTAADDTPLITATATGALEVSGIPAGTTQIAFHELLTLTA